MLKKASAMVIWLWCCALCASMSIGESEAIAEELNDNQTNCQELPLIELRRMLGAKFDPRLMDIVEPLDEYEEDRGDENDSEKYLIKRKIQEHPSIFESEDDLWPIAGKSVWVESLEHQARRKRQLLAIGFQRSTSSTTINIENTSHELLRPKRQNWKRQSQKRREPDKSADEQIRCETKLKWEDMGVDFFPRYLRTVQCTKAKCYYDKYDCKSKPFAVTILKRRRDICGDAIYSKNNGFIGDQFEVWEWVKVFVNFCCECRRTRRYF